MTTPLVRRLVALGATPEAAALPVVALTLPEPPSANRWWRHVGGRVLVSRAAREYKQATALRLLAAGVRCVDGPVAVAIDWYRGRRSGDLDKRLGVLLDALQGVAYANDSQVVAITARRFDDPGHPRIVLTLTPTETP